MKKILSIAVIAAMTVSLAGCSVVVTKQPKAGETYTGTVDSIDEDYLFIMTEEGESYRIELSEDTVYAYESTGGLSSGDMPSGGDLPDAQGDDSDGGMPDAQGDAPGGSMPDADGDASRGADDASGGDADSSGEEGAKDDGASADADSTDTSDASGSADGVSYVQTSSGTDGAQTPDGDMPGGSGDGNAPDGNAPDNSGGNTPGGDASENGGGNTPGGDTSDNSEDDSTPGGDASDEEAGSESDSTQTLTYEDVLEGDTVTVVVNDEKVAESVTITASDAERDESADNGTQDGPDGDIGGGDMGAGGSDSSAVTYSAVNEYTQDATVSSETIESTGTDESAVLVSAADAVVTLEDVTILRDSDDSTGGDNSSFYGVGASSLVTNGTLKIFNSTITSDAAGGAGVFAYGDGVAYVSDTTITTQQGTSGGIHVAGGGTLYAWDLDVTTAGESSAAIRSDRGSGTMVVDGGTYTSNGTGSPAIYCAADVTVHDAELTATSSEAICIEGLNSIRLFDCDLTGDMPESSQNDCTWNVILYQSMSGDSEVGNSTFEMIGGILTAKNGGMFYTTNTESTFILSGVDITYADDSEFLFKCTGNSNERGWGSSGSNGADSTFTAIDQVLEGDVIWDTISEMDFYLTDGSSLTGAVENDESQTGGTTGSGYGNVYIDASSTWIVTGDSTLSALYCEGTITDANGNTVTIAGSDGTEYVSGTSAYTITVDTYEESADLSGAAAADSWSDYEVSQD